MKSPGDPVRRMGNIPVPRDGNEHFKLTEGEAHGLSL